MANISLVSKLYSDKEAIINTIKTLGIENGLQIIESHETTAPNSYDFGWWLNLSDDEIYQVEFWVAPEDLFQRDKYTIDNENYYLAIYLNFQGSDIKYVSLFLKQFLALHPEMLVSDDNEKEFFTLEDLENGDVHWFQDQS